VLFAVLLATIMLPPSATIVPQFVLFSRLDWIGTWLPLVVPSLFGSAFFIFLFRQWYRTLPAHLFESAELDGATPWQAFRHVALPLSGPAVAAVAVFAFVGAWNDFLAPLVYLRTPDTFTVSLGLASFSGIHVNEVHHSLAFALLALAPPVIVFLGAQRFLVRGIAAGGWRA
jgi:ABC-type glycerol-3-phosphate transport system permease component